MSTTTATGTWQVRHEGSPQTIDGMTLQEVVEGLQEARWEPTDEVRGPDDADWVAIENHPLLEEIAADIEPAPPRGFDGESHVDMNALIDVCLVLLVFFIITTSYAALTKRLDNPDVSDSKIGPPVVKKEEANLYMVHVILKFSGEKTTYLVEGQPVEPHLLTSTFRRQVGTTGKTILLLEHDGEVPHGAVVRVQDAAKGAGMTKVLVAIPQTK